MNRLAGKRALITGGTSGIGLETARRFIAEGADVLVTGVTPASIDKARQILGDKVPVVQADARDLDAQRGLAERVREHFGELDVAFLNAGVSDWRPFEDHTEDSFDRLFDINVKSVFFLTQALVPLLANPSSVILNASSSAHGGYEIQAILLGADRVSNLGVIERKGDRATASFGHYEGLTHRENSWRLRREIEDDPAGNYRRCS